MKLKMPDGSWVEAERLDFTPICEGWNEYKLVDKTVIKTKTIVSDIFRLETTDPVTEQHIYYVRHRTVVAASEPAKEESRK